jgi:hypothetical protein
MPMPGALNDGSFSLILNGKETRAMAGNPFPADDLRKGLLEQTLTRSFARLQQKSGHGEGLIYNILRAVFQTVQ